MGSAQYLGADHDNSILLPAFSFYYSYIPITVKPLYSEHSRDPKTMFTIRGCSPKRGEIRQGDFVDWPTPGLLLG